MDIAADAGLGNTRSEKTDSTEQKAEAPSTPVHSACPGTLGLKFGRERGERRRRGRERERDKRLHLRLALHAPPHTLGCKVGRDQVAFRRLQKTESTEQKAEAPSTPVRSSCEGRGKGHVQVTSRSRPGHVPVTSRSRPGHGQVTSRPRPSNEKQFRGGLLFKARRLLHHSTLGRE